MDDPLKVRFETFEQAQSAEKKFSPTFIDGSISGQLRVGAESVGIKGYLDKVEADEEDNKIISNPEQIAATYLATTNMLARNLKILVNRNPDTAQDTARKAQLKEAKDTFLAKLRDEAGSSADSIVDWCEGKTRKFPVDAIEYKGLEVDGSDPLNAMGSSAEDFRTNFKIQRQIGGTFVMAYSDTRVQEKLHKQDEEPSKRIYLNPQIAATPQVFEQVLQAANEAGIPIQLKMFQRAPELATAHAHRKSGRAADGLRGDGIVVYAGEKEADDVLALVLAVAKDNPDAFIGRKTSRIPQKVAEGIAVGDEPLQAPGKSLTSHREEIISYVAAKVAQSGKTGEEARAAFQRGIAVVSKANGVKPTNIAFNM